MALLRILGIDPGSRLTGYGVIDFTEDRKVRHVAHGTLRLSNTGGKAVIPLEQRLLSIYEGLSKVILEHRPRVLSVERVFFAKNAVSALKLGQARGAIVLTGAIHGLEMHEYSPSEVKSGVVGHGGADKDQVARMVALMIGREDFATSDASDALALAICHAHHAVPSGASASALAGARSRWSGLGRKSGGRLADCLGITPEMVQGKTRLKGRER